MSDRPLFILAGNGPYLNRGCEAIVRGTVKILRHHYIDPKFICISHFNSRKEYKDQRDNEVDESIQHLATYRPNKNEAISTLYKPKTLKYIYRNFLDKNRLGYSIYGDVFPQLPHAMAVLSIGGDNYSLDYVIPSLFTALDDAVIDNKKPLIIWGASIGPFNSMPDYEDYMSRHLRDVNGIFARESATIDYLNSIGVRENVYLVADPAFLMDPVKPDNFTEDFPPNREAIGINLSPLMAKYITGGDIDAWAGMAASIIDQVADKTRMPLYLIPHVTIPTSDDYAFLERALSLAKCGKREIFLVPPRYNAAEIKWIISKMTVFAGARTHSTIAALSSGVPTLSFSYSIKALGINHDIFGHANYCIGPKNLEGGTVSDRILSLLDDSTAIGQELSNNIPRIRMRALGAGISLKNLIEGG